ncbi:MAG: cadherin domain-containing protein [Devosia sp.]|uniref:cadherin domain-containing protein n=1 Tax=Devosia sp. TaxID=1871048 RepID=UPI001AD5B079|nr:cadherin domain-containing protein [Devosia sp.]MBN9317077.1 cadherin domain-containing protein [Devosia sp.]
MTYAAPPYIASKYLHSDSLYAALALDSYSRGYGAKLHAVGDSNALLLATPNKDLGLAQVIFDSAALGFDGSDFRDEQVGFHAVAYKVDGEVVISYRGSDQLFWDDMGTVANIGAGNVDDHVRLALEFYNLVQDKIVNTPSLSGLPIITVGHSLGGALAGIVASVKKTAGLMFDNTGFEWAAETVMDAALGPNADLELAELIFRGQPSWTEAEATSLKTMSLTHDVAGIFFRGPQLAHQDTTLDLGNYVLVPGWDSPNAHIQSLLAYRLLLKEKFGSDMNWEQAASQIITPLMDDVLASDIGILASQFGSAKSGVLKDMISQTIIGGEFGNSAAEAMTDDMNDLGRAIVNGVVVDFELGYQVARYAGGLAIEAVFGDFDGILSFNAAKNILTADLSEQTWDAVGDSRSDLGLRHDFSWLMNDGGLSSADMALLMQGPGRYDSLVYASDVTNLQLPTLSSGGATKFVAGIGVQSVVGTGASEYFDLGSGDDTVVTNAGIDWIFGGLGIDTLESTLAWSDFTIQYHGDTLVLAKRGETSTPTIFLTDSVEQFALDDLEFDLSNIMNVAPIGSEFVSGALHLEGVIDAGAEVARLGGIDDNPDLFTWALHADSLEHFYLDGNIVRAAHDITLDFEQYVGMLGGAPILDLVNGVSQQTWWQTPAFMNSIYVVKAIVSDSYGLTALTNLVLGIENVNEAPENMRFVGGDLVTAVNELTIAENNAVGTRVAIADADDPEGDGLTWSLLDDGGMFRIDPITGEVFIDGPLDFESDPEINLTVRAHDGEKHVDRELTVMLEDRNEAPTSFSYELLDLLQGMPAGSVVAYLGNVVDGDAADEAHFGGSGGAPRFQIVSDPSGLFSIVGDEIRTTGVIGAQQYTVTVAARDAAGTLSSATAISFFVNAAGAPSNVQSTSGDDVLHGTSQTDYILGGGGNDTIYGFGMNDYLWGDAGNDHLYGGAGNDQLYGGAGDNYLYGGDGNDQFWSEGSNDRMFGGSGDDRFDVSDGNHYVHGGSGADIFELNGSGFVRAYAGGDSDWDLFHLNGSGTYELHLDGNDYAFTHAMTGRARIYVGAAGGDLIGAGSAPVVVYGQRGYFSFESLERSSATIYSGSAGSIMGLMGTNSLWGGDGEDYVHSYEGGGTFRLGGGNDYIWVTESSRIWDGAGDDIVDGSTANDTFYMGSGNDMITGGGGVDYAVYDANFEAFTFEETVGQLKIVGSSGTDSLYDIDYVRFRNGTWSYADLVAVAQQEQEWLI